MSQQFCLKWNNHMNNMMDVFKNLLSTESMVDVTLACDGLSLKAHKIVLSACSPFFQSLFLENPCKHPIVILKDMKYSELKAIIEFMYHGEVNVAQDQLSALMKTAETLRVKGLAEVTNEKNSQSSNASQEEPGHRSVPRTETPPPSKRRRGRVRKRSLSDSNRSDDSNEPKIKQPVSPDIEELSGDHTMDASIGQFSNLQSQVPMQSTPSHNTNSFHKSSVVSQDPQIEEPPSADESEFGVEPAKLLEQTLTTDDLSNARRSGRSSIPSGMEMQRRPRSSTDHSSSLVPTSMPSEALGSNQQPESPPDIKPELLELDPPMSPVAGPSHSTDNSMMMYMDQSSVSSHPGTSYQDNSGALVPQDSQPQERFTCDKCEHVLTSKEALSKHRLRHRSDAKEKRHQCTLCSYATNYSSHLKQHMFTHSGERPFKCTECNSAFTQKWHLRKHMLGHADKQPATLHKCDRCPETFADAKLLQKHSKLHRKEDKPFRCAVCSKRFPRSSSLRRHEKRHLEDKKTSATDKRSLVKEPSPTTGDLGSSQPLKEVKTPTERNKGTSTTLAGGCSATEQDEGKLPITIARCSPTDSSKRASSTSIGRHLSTDKHEEISSKMTGRCLPNEQNTRIATIRSPSTEHDENISLTPIGKSSPTEPDKKTSSTLMSRRSPNEQNTRISTIRSPSVEQDENISSLPISRHSKTEPDIKTLSTLISRRSPNELNTRISTIRSPSTEHDENISSTHIGRRLTNETDKITWSAAICRRSQTEQIKRTSSIGRSSSTEQDEKLSSTPIGRRSPTISEKSSHSLKDMLLSGKGRHMSSSPREVDRYSSSSPREKERNKCFSPQDKDSLSQISNKDVLVRKEKSFAIDRSRPYDRDKGRKDDRLSYQRTKSLDMTSSGQKEKSMDRRTSDQRERSLDRRPIDLREKSLHKDKRLDSRKDKLFSEEKERLREKSREDQKRSSSHKEHIPRSSSKEETKRSSHGPKTPPPSKGRPKTPPEDPDSKITKTELSSTEKQKSPPVHFKPPLNLSSKN